MATKGTRTAWKGAISIGGLLTIPVRLEKATTDHRMSLHEYHKDDMGQGGRKVYCKSCAKDLTEEDLVKGYEVTKGQIITFSEAELNSLPLSTVHNIDVCFAEANEVEPLALDEAYYIIPDDIGVRAFNVLMAGLNKLGKVAVGKVAIRNREHICTIQPEGDKFLLTTLHWADELRESPTVPKAEVKQTELDLITQVIGKFSKKLNLGDFADDYNEALKTMAEKKMKGETITVAETVAPKQEQSLEDALRILTQAPPTCEENTGTATAVKEKKTRGKQTK